MTPNEAVTQIWTEFLHCGELDNDLEQEAVEIINAAVATATAELAAKLAEADKLVARWRSEVTLGKTAREYSDELEQALAKGAE